VEDMRCCVDRDRCGSSDYLREGCGSSDYLRESCGSSDDLKERAVEVVKI